MFGIDDIVAAGGFAMGVAGGLMGMTQAKHISEDQKNIQLLQSQADAQRRLAMEINARRSLLQDTREGQIRAAMVRANAQTSNAQFGSGMAGGQAAVSGMTSYNQQGTLQNLAIGEEMFRLNDLETGYKMDITRRQGLESMDQGLMGIGKSMMGAAKPLGDMLGDYNNFSKWGSLFGGGSSTA